jgi:predicted metal-binding membrane protein
MATSAQLRRDRVILLGGLACVSATGWFVLAHMGAGLAGPHPSAMPGMLMTNPTNGPSPGYGMALAMWAAMMVAMMAPAIAPSLSAYLVLAHRRYPDRSATLAAAGFLAGHFGAWLGYAALAAAAQSALATAMRLTPTGALASPHLASGVLIAAGVYQLTPLKRVCITHCRSPLLQLMGTWRDGGSGALRLGFGYGSWCVACCWAIMALMFVVGVMNLFWMAVITIVILAEKLVPARWRIDLIAGVLLIGAGAWVALAVAG